jgi:3-hydroxyisobutyrate dehydrogenase-like beta-hydroxyacid dehydrogenase
MHEKLLNGEATMSVVGLGYVGLPIALAFAKHIKVIGFDINPERVEMMRNRVDPSEELEASDFDGCDITFTANPEDLKQAQFHIVAVPTPINQSNHPDLKPLLSASATVGSALKPGDYVVYESTVYPGCTEEDCVPVLEEVSGLKFNEDFKVGYSPERINPGDKVNTIETIVKVVSGSDAESADHIARTYDLVVKAGTHRASSIKVAEASKIIENTQRDVNIALINELSIIFERIGINTYEVLEAAGTKWNFLKFSPGLGRRPLHRHRPLLPDVEIGQAGLSRPGHQLRTLRQRRHGRPRGQASRQAHVGPRPQPARLPHPRHGPHLQRGCGRYPKHQGDRRHPRIEELQHRRGRCRSVCQSGRSGTRIRHYLEGFPR